MLYIIKGKPLRGQDHTKNYLQISHSQIAGVIFMLMFGFNFWLAALLLTLFTFRVFILIWPEDSRDNLQRANDLKSEAEDLGMDHEMILTRMSKIKNVFYSYIKL
tara:strand:+ start:2039 stop:2353 length:315 start_codon:yes stop_codon:yes gene_type:complete